MADFLSGINQTIGDNMRFIRDFKANPENYAGSSSSKSNQSGSAADEPWQMLNPIIMLMMFQMMMKMMTQMGAGLPQGFPPVTDIPGTGTVQDPSGTITQNPAVQYFENRFKALSTANPNATEISWSAEETAKLKAEISKGTITMTQVGQALMYELDKTDAKNRPAVGGVISDLMESGDLNITPFLQNDYLGQLKAESQDTLFSAVELSGLRMSNGQPNARFVSFLLENLSKENPNKASQPKTQTFIQQFMQDFYNVHGKDATTPVGSVLAQIISLTGIKADDKGKLVFN